MQSFLFGPGLIMVKKAPKFYTVFVSWMLFCIVRILRKNLTMIFFDVVD